ncbi:sex peptide receptor-like isoform X1 [Pecten maximus]|uniref:sex peptide receptor-like isoform X1 n=1 Tax=Pecten maximus TaxID=6579 RepID=UPI00145850DB|nr:sex peptide receptor-like isoform X1 [Pecten maximus]
MEENEMGLPPLIYDVPSPFNTALARGLYGVAAPVIVLLTILNNIMVVITMHSDLPKRGSASRIQHAAIACSNSLVGIVQLPVHFYFFAAPSFPAYISKPWCGAFRILGFVLPHIFHTISLWQFIGLSVQRYLVFRFPFSCVTWYNIDNMTKLVKILTFAGFIVNIPKLFDFEIIDFDENMILNNASYVIGKTLSCRAEYRFINGRNGYALFSSWFVTITVHIVPCTTLTTVYILLISAIYKNNTRRQNLSRNSRTGRRQARNQTIKECSVLVMMTTCLVVEIPSAIVRVKQLIFTKRDVTSGGGEEIILTHFFLLFSYYFYVYIYLIMNRDFRTTFLSILRKLRPIPQPDATELQVIRRAV